MLAMVVRPGKPVRHAGRYRVPERFGLSGHDLGVDAIPPDLDRWLADPTVRVAHRRESEAARDRLWQAAQQVRGTTPELTNTLNQKKGGISMTEILNIQTCKACADTRLTFLLEE